MANMVEIDETELDNYRRVARAVQTMEKNPKSRKLILEANKAAFPDMVIPEIDAKNEVLEVANAATAAATAAQKQIDGWIAAQEAQKKVDEFRSAWEGKKNTLRNQGYTDEGITKIEALAQERGIPDLDAAAALFDKLNPPPMPASPSGYGSFDLFSPSDREGAEVKALLESKGEDSMALSKLIDSTLTEIRGGTRR
jgi:hypothetical protein